MKKSIVATNRRVFLQRASAIAGFLGLSTFLPQPANSKPIKGSFVHVVYFWMKNPDSLEDKQKLINNLKELVGKVREIKTSHIGTPAMTKREVVDNSYGVCLIVTFDNAEDQDIYQDHPAHIAFIEKTKDVWDRVQVYDSIEV